MEATRLERKADEARRKAETRTKAAAIWKAAMRAPDDYPYLLRKGVKAHGTRLHKDALALPMRDTEGALHSIQFIGPDGKKRFLTGGRVAGCYFGVGKPKGRLYICEGFATGATVHEATGDAAACAFSAGNLMAVASALRAKFPDIRLIVCADDDANTPGNPGLTKAREAAQAVGALLAVPEFGASRLDTDTDFNDMATRRGHRGCA